jgi:hypothetical protein
MRVPVLGLGGSPRVPGAVGIIPIAGAAVVHGVVVTVWSSHERAVRPLGLGASSIVAVLLVPGSIIHGTLISISCSGCISDLTNKIRY